jgi:hypothetical protein
VHTHNHLLLSPLIPNPPPHKLHPVSPIVLSTHSPLHHRSHASLHLNHRSSSPRKLQSRLRLTTYTSTYNNIFVRTNNDTTRPPHRLPHPLLFLPHLPRLRHPRRPRLHLCHPNEIYNVLPRRAQLRSTPRRFRAASSANRRVLWLDQSKVRACDELVGNRSASRGCVLEIH